MAYAKICKCGHIMANHRRGGKLGKLVYRDCESSIYCPCELFVFEVEKPC